MKKLILATIVASVCTLAIAAEDAEDDMWIGIDDSVYNYADGPPGTAQYRCQGKGDWTDISKGSDLVHCLESVSIYVTFHDKNSKTGAKIGSSSLTVDADTASSTDTCYAGDANIWDIHRRPIQNVYYTVRSTCRTAPGNPRIY